jgi:signal transduction histidine kinase
LPGYWTSTGCGGIFRFHPPVILGEYFEAGTISLIYIVMGSLVWLLADNLRNGQRRLEQSMDELEQTRSKLLMEERLAAVGRLSSAIAHEVRNPVAMISSSLEAIAGEDLDSESRREMLGIAVREASRLEKLTGEFLTYARPETLEKSRCELDSILSYVASVCRSHASKLTMTIEVECPPGILLDADSERVEQALLNLLMNAMDAAGERGTIRVVATRVAGEIRIDVDNPNGPIALQNVDLLFEPFFTTKPQGTGLGLAISRKIARAHGGDLKLSINSPEIVRFSMTLPCEGVSQSALNKEVHG